MFGGGVRRASITFGQGTLNTNSTAKVASVVGAGGARLFAVVIVTNQAATNGTLTDDKGGTWNYLVFASNSAPNRSCAIWWRSELLTDASTVTVTYTPGASPTTNDGGGLVVFRVDGLGPAWNVVGGTASDPANGVPALTSSAPPVANSVMLGVVINNSIAVAAPANWETQAQGGYANPTLNYTVATCDAGEATQTTTWGISSALNWCGAQVEILPGA